MEKISKISSKILSRVHILVQERLTEKVNPENGTTPLSGQPFVHYPNDISVLVNLEKIRKFSPDSVQSVISEFARSGSVLSQSLKNIPDQKIIDTLKSRYIQSSADVHSFNRWLKANFEYEVEKIINSEKEEDGNLQNSSQGSSNTVQNSSTAQ